MSQVTLDTCGCILAIDDATGEPNTFMAPCAVHAGGPVAQPVAECRAKNAAVAVALAADPTAVLDYSFDDTRTVSVSKLVAGKGVVVATSAPLSLAEFDSAIAAVVVSADPLA